MGRHKTSRVRLVDVAKVAGVAPSTVSRALSTPSRVNADTAERVVRIAMRMGYFPRRRRAASPARNRRRVISLVVRDSSNEVSSQIFKGARMRALESDCMVAQVESADTPEGERMLIERLGKVGDGVILASDQLSDLTIAKLARHIPLVVVNRPVPHVSSVIPDADLGMVRALTLLMQSGHESVIYVAGLQGVWADRSRWESVSAVGALLGMDVRRIGPVQPTLEGGSQAAILLEDEKVLPTAVITYNELVAAGMMIRLGDDGHRIPQEMSVISFDDTQVSRASSPSITAIRVPRTLMGSTAVGILLEGEGGYHQEQIRNETHDADKRFASGIGRRRQLEEIPIGVVRKSESLTVVSTSLIVRESTARCRDAG